MDANFITPLTSMMQPLENNPAAVRLQQEDKGSFKDIFDQLVNNVVSTEVINEHGVLEGSTGITDQLHTAMIASTQTTMALELFVQVRNRAQEAYSEIMRMNV